MAGHLPGHGLSPSLSHCHFISSYVLVFYSHLSFSMTLTRLRSGCQIWSMLKHLSLHFSLCAHCTSPPPTLPPSQEISLRLILNYIEVSLEICNSLGQFPRVSQWFASDHLNLRVSIFGHSIAVFDQKSYVCIRDAAAQFSVQPDEYTDDPQHL